MKRHASQTAKKKEELIELDDEIEALLREKVLRSMKKNLEGSESEDESESLKEKRAALLRRIKADPDYWMKITKGTEDSA